MKTVTVQELQNAIITFQKEREWKQFHNLKDMLISLNLEASEALELVQWKTQEELVRLSDRDKEKLSEELVDVLNWVLTIMHDMSIDVETAFQKKMQQNREKYPLQKVKGKREKYTEY